MVNKLIKNRDMLGKKVKSKTLWFLIIVGILVMLALTGVILFKMEIIFKPKPGSCLILEEKYCKKVVIERSVSGGIIRLKYLLPKGAILFAPESGNYSNTVFNVGNNEDYGDIISVNDDNKNDSYTYSFIYSKLKSTTDRPIKIGEQFNRISNKKLSIFPEYNLVVFVNKKIILEGKTVSGVYLAKLEQLAKYK